MRKDFEIDSEIIIDDVRGNLPDEGSLQVNGNTADIPSGVIPLASTAVGQKLKVYASKTRAQALSLTGANPQALFFPTDAESIIFNGKEYGVSGTSDLKSINGVDTNYMPARIDFCAICTSAADSSTKEIDLLSKDGKSWANTNYPRILFVKFTEGNTYQGRTVYLSINGGEQKVRMGDARGFPYLPPGASLILSCNGGIQWDIVGSSVIHYEIGDVTAITSTPTSAQLDTLFGTHDGTLNHPLMLAIKGGCTIVSDSTFGEIVVTGWTNSYTVGINYNIAGMIVSISATNTVSGWGSASYAKYDLSKIPK